MSTIEEIISRYIVQQKQENEDSSANLKPKYYIWDKIIFSLAAAIFGLSISSIIVEFLKSNEYSLACFSSFENRGQYTYINSYCHKHLPRGEFFPMILVAHAALLVLPHYFWVATLSKQFGFFFSHAEKISLLRESNTGKYPLQNYKIVNHLKSVFGYRNHITMSYFIKLGIQLFFVALMLTVNFVWFSEINDEIMFECSDDKEINQVFGGNVTCANPRKLFTNIFKVIDYALLSLAAIVLTTVGCLILLCYCLIKIDTNSAAIFCYESCIDSEYYYKPPKRLHSLYFKLNNNFEFFLDLLDFGLRRIFETIRIDNEIAQRYVEDLHKFAKEQSNKQHDQDTTKKQELTLEQPKEEDNRNISSPTIKQEDTIDKQTDKTKLISPANKEATIDIQIDETSSISSSNKDVPKEEAKPNTSSQTSNEEATIDIQIDENSSISSSNQDVPKEEAKPNTSSQTSNEAKSSQFGELIHTLCKEICEGIRDDIIRGKKLMVMDIASGYHSYVFDIRRHCNLKVLSLVLGFNGEDKTEVIASGEHYSKMMLLKIPVNLLSLKEDYKQSKEKFFTKIGDFAEANENCIIIIVGPMDSQQKCNTVSQIVEKYTKKNKLMKLNTVMLIIKPISVDNIDISNHFIDWNPGLTRNWDQKDLFQYTQWREKATKSVGECHSWEEEMGGNGSTTFKFRLTAYKYCGVELPTNIKEID